MKIVIPMAGHSRRFRDAGYDVPKPFIMIDGKTMIERVCLMFSPTDEFIFVCRKEHASNAVYRKMLEGAARNVTIIEVDNHERGPVYSALMSAAAFKDDREPVIISYCDFTMRWDYRQFLRKAELYEGAILVFRGFHPASFGDTYYAYVKADESLEMIELREKRSFTDKRTEEFASTGVYYFDSWRTFAHYAEKALIEKDAVGAEYYCSLLYNRMVSDGRRVCLFEAEKFICWGTPEDLEEYMFWSGYFANEAMRMSGEEPADD